MAPEPNFLWTPGYWGWGGNGYAFNEGYWGLHVGFYGGVSYGYGYFGDGYEGGRWQDGHFFYNRSVNNVNITNIHNVYNTTVIHNNGESGQLQRRHWRHRPASHGAGRKLLAGEACPARGRSE